MNDFAAYFITWTTYGTWLPGDARGWRRRCGGLQVPQPLLEDWCQKQQNGEAVLLRPHDREAVEFACHEHAVVRGWEINAINARTNHVHVVVSAAEKPEKVRDQFKANCTRMLRQQIEPLVCEKTWTKGGDCELLAGDKDVEAAVLYVLEGQDFNP